MLIDFETILCYIAGVLITGGYPNSNTAELYLPSSSAMCTLPTLPAHSHRVGHTADDGLLCGGWETSDTCLQWSTDMGSWEAAVNLEIGRFYQISWTPAIGRGTFLMGGGYSTTLITPDGTQEPGFQLEHDAT